VKPILLRIGFAISLVAMLGFVHCSENGNDPGEPEFSIHEWGVLVGCASDDSFDLTCRPEVNEMVRIPVIYFHGDDAFECNVNVAFKDGAPLETYPEADIDGSVAVWNPVHVGQPPMPDRAMDKPAGYVPLEEVIEELRLTDAQLLHYGSVQERFLYYEGEVSYQNPISVTWDFAQGEAVFENTADYPVHRVFLVGIVNDTEHFEPTGFVCDAGTLNAGETRAVALDLSGEIDLQRDLLTLGFTQGEAKAFATLWHPPIFESLLDGPWVNLVYRLPADVYDDMISLQITPAPTETIRALYVLVHLLE